MHRATITEFDADSVDPRLAWLARASAWHALIEAGAAELDAAIAALGLCQCQREILDRWERGYQEWRRQPRRVR